jgi:hypothetical protein
LNNTLQRDKILGRKMVLPEHVIQFIPASSKIEAHYICAVLNSSVVKANLQTLSGGGKSGLSKSIISKVRLDKFDPKNRLHVHLAELSIKAHNQAQSGNLQALRKTEKILNKRVDLLYKNPKKVINHFNV